MGPLTAAASDAVPVALGGGALVLYLRRAATLAARGRPVERRRLAAGAGGVALVLAALSPPVDRAADRTLAAHMGQHILLGDLAPLLLALALTGPLLRPLLARRALFRLRVLVHPLVALPVWALVFGAWHVPALYDAALEHPLLHELEHGSFLAAGLLAWMPVVETLPGPRGFGPGWKLGYSVAQRTAMGAVGYLLFFASEPLYGYYGANSEALDDQRLAAGVMMLESAVVGFVVLAVVFLRLLAGAEAAQLRAEARATPARRTP